MKSEDTEALDTDR